MIYRTLNLAQHKPKLSSSVAANWSSKAVAVGESNEVVDGSKYNDKVWIGYGLKRTHPGRIR